MEQKICQLKENILIQIRMKKWVYGFALCDDLNEPMENMYTWTRDDKYKFYHYSTIYSLWISLSKTEGHTNT